MSEEKQRVVTHKVVTVNLPIVRAPGWLEGFVNFVREQGVVGLAVGLILGIAAKSVVDSLVTYIFNPVIGLATGGGSLENKAACMRSVKGVCTNSLGYGHVLSDILSFLIIAAIVYFLVKGLKLDRLDKKKEVKTGE